MAGKCGPAASPKVAGRFLVPGVYPYSYSGALGRRVICAGEERKTTRNKIFAESLNFGSNRFSNLM
jgi:hypothetical protein